MSQPIYGDKPTHELQPRAQQRLRELMIEDAGVWALHRDVMNGGDPGPDRDRKRYERRGRPSIVGSDGLPVRRYRSGE